MQAWRLCRRRYAELNGNGAASTGGRGNPVGLPMVYMSSSDALAVLEVRVHLRRYIPRSFVFVTAEVPDELIATVEGREPLPPNWNEDLVWSRAAGERFLKDESSVALSVPSRVVPVGRNILLNPRHPEFARVVTNPPAPFEWDRRLFEGVEPAFRTFEGSE